MSFILQRCICIVLFIWIGLVLFVLLLIQLRKNALILVFYQQDITIDHFWLLLFAFPLVLGQNFFYLICTKKFLHYVRHIGFKPRIIVWKIRQHFLVLESIRFLLQLSMHGCMLCPGNSCSPCIHSLFEIMHRISITSLMKFVEFCSFNFPSGKQKV